MLYKQHFPFSTSHHSSHSFAVAHLLLLFQAEFLRMSIGVATIFQQVCVRIHVEKIFSECLTPAIFFASITAATATYARMGGLFPKVRISDLLMSFTCSGIHHRLNYKYSLQLNIAFNSGETCQVLFNEYINPLTL